VFIGIIGTLVVVGVALFLLRSQLAPIFSMPTLPSLPTPVPSPTPVVVTGPAIIQKIQQMNRLDATRYTIETVVEAETPGGWLGLKRGEKLLLIAHGSVIAGFDLGKLQLQDVIVSPDGKTISITLPPVELESSLDEQKTRVYSRDAATYVGLLNAKPDPNLESKARQDGLAKILVSACEDGILDRATKDGRAAMTQLLSLSGFNSVQIDVRTAATSPCAAAANPTAVP
jgi:hypothetical protein